MQRRIFCVIAVSLISTAIVCAQLPPPQGGLGQGGLGQGGLGQGGLAPPAFALMTALDADRDGRISPEEIENATAVLAKLDKDKDGKLSAKEIGWPPQRGFGGRGFVGRGSRVGRGGRARGGFGLGRFNPFGGGKRNGRPQIDDLDPPKE